MEKTYSLKEIKEALDTTIQCLEKALELANTSDKETGEEEKEIVGYITINTAKLVRKQVLERLKENNITEIMDMLTKIFEE